MPACETITVDPEVEDVSVVEIRNVNFTSPNPESVQVRFSLVNVVESGQGETLSASVPITINGGSKSTVSETLGPGESAQFEESYPAPAGEVRVCVGE